MQPGITRHADVVALLDEFQFEIVSSRFGSMLSGTSKRFDGFRFIPTIAYHRNDLRRVSNWLMYFVGSVWVGSWRRRPDLVMASSPHLLSGLAGLITARRWSVPFIFEVRDLWPQVLVEMGALRANSLVHRVLQRAESYLYESADLIVVLSMGMKDELLKRGQPNNRIVVIPNFSTVEAKREDLARIPCREEFGFRGETFVYAGSHGPANGLELILDALKFSEPGEFTVWLVGSGVKKDDLQRRVRDEKIPNIKFMDPIPKEQMGALLLGADFGLHILADVPLFEYGISPNKIFDYLATGLPTLTVTRGETERLLRDTGAGVSVHRSQLLDAMRKMCLLTKEQRDKMSQAGIDFTRSEGSPSTRSALFASLFADALDSD